MQVTERVSLPLQRSFTVGPFERVLVGWGLLTLWIYVISFITPPVFGLGYLRMFYLGSGVAWCLFAGSLTKFNLRLSFPIIAALIIQLWSFVTMMHSWYILGRVPTLGRPELYLLEIIVPFFIASGLNFIAPGTRRHIMTCIVAVFTFSCVVAILQFFKFPPAVKLSHYFTYKDIDFWDGTVALRAVGLANHPGTLAFQATCCLGAVGCAITKRLLNSREMILMFIYSAAIVMSQARIAYFIMFAIWGIIFYTMGRRNLILMISILGMAVVLLGSAFILAPNRLGYALQSTSASEDSSYKYRSNVVWAQSRRIYEQYPIMGIGPDGMIFIGEGKQDQYNTDGHIMESMYRTYLAMYGLPGLIFLIASLIGGLAIAAMIVGTRTESDERRQIGFVCVCLVIVLMVNGYTSNTLDSYTIPQMLFIIIGLAMKNRQELTERGMPIPYYSGSGHEIAALRARPTPLASGSEVE